MKKLIDFRINAKEALGGGDWLLRLSPLGAEMPTTLPGQFVNVAVANTTEAYLRRPISVCDIVDGQLVLWIKEAGAGTKGILESRVGDRLNILMPLGNGFPMPENRDARLLLIGGGVGCAPLLYLGKELRRRGMKPAFLLGARNSELLHLTDQFESVGYLQIATEDGSRGEKGMVTQHTIMEGSWDAVYCCGPMPMMRAVAKIMEANGVLCYVSLENHMACGLGACLCCVQDTREGHKCVCTDGPVFDSRELKW